MRSSYLICIFFSKPSIILYHTRICFVNLAGAAALYVQVITTPTQIFPTTTAISPLRFSIHRAIMPHCKNYEAPLRKTGRMNLLIEKIRPWYDHSLNISISLLYFTSMAVGHHQIKPSAFRKYR